MQQFGHMEGYYKREELQGLGERKPFFDYILENHSFLNAGKQFFPKDLSVIGLMNYECMLYCAFSHNTIFVRGILAMKNACPNLLLVFDPANLNPPSPEVTYTFFLYRYVQPGTTNLGKNDLSLPQQKISRYQLHYQHEYRFGNNLRSSSGTTFKNIFRNSWELHNLPMSNVSMLKHFQWNYYTLVYGTSCSATGYRKKLTDSSVSHRDKVFSIMNSSITCYSLSLSVMNTNLTLYYYITVIYNQRQVYATFTWPDHCSSLVGTISLNSTNIIGKYNTAVFNHIKTVPLTMLSVLPECHHLQSKVCSVPILFKLEIQHINKDGQNCQATLQTKQYKPKFQQFEKYQRHGIEYRNRYHYIFNSELESSLSWNTAKEKCSRRDGSSVLFYMNSDEAKAISNYLHYKFLRGLPTLIFTAWKTILNVSKTIERYFNIIFKFDIPEVIYKSLPN